MKKLLAWGLSLVLIFSACTAVGAVEVTDESKALSTVMTLGTGITGGSGKQFYLSDFTMDEMIQCDVGWGSYTRDENLDGNTVSLWVDGKKTYFLKAVTAHATATLIYDFGENYADYSRFSAYIGVDSSREGNGNVKYSFSLSADNAVYTAVDFAAANTVFTGNSPAAKVDFSLNGARYLKVEINQNGNNAADHSVLADAKVYSQDYAAPTFNILRATYTNESNMPVTVDLTEDFLADWLSQYEYEEILENSDLELALFRYYVINHCGYEALQLFLSNSERQTDRIQMLEWFLNDATAMEYYLSGGEPSGDNYLGSMDVLARLYAAYKNDYTIQTPLSPADDDLLNPTVGDLYLRMSIALAITHAETLNAWMARNTPSDAVVRYKYFKKLYTENKLRKDVFNNLCIEEMRWVMGNHVADAEIIWLNDYARANPRYGTDDWYPILYSPHHHISYKWYNYDSDYLYSEANRAEYTAKYRLLPEYEEYGLTYGLTNGVKVQRLWHVFVEGAVCGNISRTGVNLAGVFGVPAAEVGQPGHCAFYVYNRNSAGQGIWGIDNNISGWLGSNYSWRMPADWGSWYNGWGYSYRGAYILTAQTAFNDIEHYTQAEELMALESLAQSDAQKEKLYRTVVKLAPYHVDAWHNLVTLAINNSEKSSAELSELAYDISKAMRYEPLPMHDLVTLLKNAITSRINAASDEETLLDEQNALARCNMVLKSGLNAATQATAENCAQPDAVQSIAKTLLGNNDYQLATFSFDGENAGKLVFNSSFHSVRFRFCLNYTADGIDNETWITRTEYAENGNAPIYAFTDAELSQIDDTHDIVILLEGLTDSAENYFTIDILPGSTITGLYNNDNENRLLGDVSCMEYSSDAGETWDTLESTTLFEGDITVWVRKIANGCILASPIATYTFTDNRFDDDFSYISVLRQSLYDFSSQEASKNDYAAYAIDGIPSTRWHTYWYSSDTQRYLTVKLNAPTYLSGIGYVGPGGNGTFLSCEVYASLDGTNWFLAGAAENWGNDNTRKELRFEAPVYAQYVKIHGKSTVNNYAAAHTVELFENKTFEGATPIGLVLNREPLKEEYKVGQKLDLTGLSVSCVFNNGNTLNIPNYMITADCDLLETTGKKTIHLSYSDLEPIDISVTVFENDLIPTDLFIETSDVLTDYYVGESLSLQGLLVSLSDGENVWYPTDYTVDAEAVFTEAGEKRVTVRYGELAQSFTVTVALAPTLAITNPPDCTTYQLGECFDYSGMAVTLTDANNEVRTLAAGDLQVDNPDFSQSAGTKTVQLHLTGHPTIGVSVDVSVYNYVTSGNFRFEIIGDQLRVCRLNSYDGNETVVTVPESVTVNGKIYPVTEISNEAFLSAGTVTQLILPDTVTTIGADAFAGMTALQTLTMPAAALSSGAAAMENLSDCLSGLVLTGETVHFAADTLAGMKNLAHIALPDVSEINQITIEDNALPDSENCRLYLANESLCTAIAEKYPDSSPLGGYLPVTLRGNYAAIHLSLPKKTEYLLGDTIDLSDLAVYADTTFGATVRLNSDAYTIQLPSLNQYGDAVVRVVVNDTALSESFTVCMLNKAPKITVQPISGNLDTALTVAAAGVTENLVYCWYFSTDNRFDITEDTRLSAETANVMPQKEGYYYAVIYERDAAGSYSLGTYSMAAKVTNAVPFKNTRTGVTYADLSTAVTEAESGDTINLWGNAFFDSAATVPAGKTVTLTATDGHILTRQAGYYGSLLAVNGGILNLGNITIDGGAVWSGTVDNTLQRANSNAGITATASLITVSADSEVNFNADTVIRNVACNVGGAVVSVHAGSANAIINLNDGITVKNCTCNSSYGGLFYISSYGKISVNGGSFTGNRGGVIATNSKTASPIDISGGIFAHNHGGNYGGVVFIGGPSVLNISGGTFSENYGPRGGAICNFNGGSTNISGGSFIGNSSANGGVIYEEKGGTKLNITGGSFISNTAASCGGAIYVSNISVRDAAFKLNRAGESGGAVWGKTAGCAVTLQKVIFENNECGYNGKYGYGGAVNVQGKLTVTDCRFAGNTGLSAGAICNGDDFATEIDGSEFSDNQARSGAGGAVNVGGVLTIGKTAACTFNRNLTTRGGIVCNRSTTAESRIYNCGFADNSNGVLSVQQSLTLQNSTFNGNGAFTDAAGMKVLTFADMPTAVAAGDFAGCTALTDVYFPSDLAAFRTLPIGDNNAPLLQAKIHCRMSAVFYGYVIPSAKAIGIESITADTEQLYIPNTLFGYTVTAVDDNAMKTLENIQICCDKQGDAYRIATQKGLSVKTVLLQDLTGEFIIDSQELIYIKKALLGLSSSTDAADVNQDGSLDVRDLVCVKKAFCALDY